MFLRVGISCDKGAMETNVIYLWYICDMGPKILGGTPVCMYVQMLSYPFSTKVVPGSGQSFQTAKESDLGEENVAPTLCGSWT